MIQAHLTNNIGRGNINSMENNEERGPSRNCYQNQACLALSQVFLIATSILMMCSAAILVKFYHLDKLEFWSPLFMLVPTYMISLGVSTFLVSIFGFALAVTRSENLGLNVTFVVLLVVIFLAQLGSVFTSWELRSIIKKDVSDVIIII